MCHVKLVYVLAVVCFLCQGASVPAATVGLRERLGSFNRYYLSSWRNIEAGVDLMLPIANTAAGVAALSLSNTQNMAIVVHGHQGRARSEFGITLRDSLITSDMDMAVILVDWQFVAAFNYDQAAALVSSVASDLSDFIQLMVEHGKLDVNLVHLIGFDLGAHVVGMASRNLPTRAIKITGLDPAGKGWDFYSGRLNATDAEFVEVIHTDSDGITAFGMSEPIGTIDFFPNGGTKQPGCAVDNNGCYHNRAWQLFGATVDYRGHLVGFNCETMMQMYNNSCAGPTALMGTTQLTKLDTGIYRVNTGSIYPYAVV